MPVCDTCRFYLTTLGGQRGTCHRHAPTTAGWPEVSRWDFCGDHRLDESKLVPEPLFPDTDVLAAHDPESCDFCQGGGPVPFAQEEP